MLRFIVIGITDNPQPWFPPEVMEIIRQGKAFSGGRRHHEIVMPLLPPDAEWIDITVPLEKVFEQYRSLPQTPPQGRGFRPHEDLSLPFGKEEGRGENSLPLGKGEGMGLIVFASGDPIFFGFANTLRREFPEAEIKVYPTFNSLQMLAHRLVLPYHDMRIVSLTGRPWPEFDRALIERTPKIGILTDKEHTPAAIAQRMIEYGYTYYNMYVGEHLGNPDLERVTALSLEEAAQRTFAMPNCVIIRSKEQGARGKEQGARGKGQEECFRQNDKRTANVSSCSLPLAPCSLPLTRPFGLTDSSFALLDGREKMITKMPIRLLTLQALDLPHRHVLWDIGFCTGSVSIEARLQFPHLHIEAFEVRPECEAIIHENMRRHGAPGIGVHIGDFCSVCCDDIATEKTPDAVFIGGHGGRLKEIMAKVLQYLTPDGVIVMNSVVAPKVTRDSHRLWDEACRELGLRQDPPTRIQLDDNHPITILRCHR